MEIFLLLGAFFKAMLFVLAAILPIINPLAMAPTFLSLTEGASKQTRAALAKRIGLNTLGLLSGAMLLGSHVLDFFGVSLPVVRVAGGMIVAKTAWNLLNSRPQDKNDREHMADTFTAEEARRQAFYPMTFPISCGPGSMAASITVGAALVDPQWSVFTARLGGALVANFLIGLTVYLVYRHARRLLDPLGETGMVVFLRLSAFILLCVGVQIVWDGVSEMLRGLIHDLPPAA